LHSDNPPTLVLSLSKDERWRSWFDKLTMSVLAAFRSRDAYANAADVGVRHQQQVLVVAFEARILDRHVVLGCARERIVRDGPRLREHLRIFDPRFVVDRVGVDGRIAFGHAIQVAVWNAVTSR